VKGRNNMNKSNESYIYTGAGLALGVALGSLLWTLTQNLVFLALGPAMGLVIGAAVDGLSEERK
jgi:hypothetical protein